MSRRRLNSAFQSDDVVLTIRDPFRYARIGPLAVILFDHGFAGLALHKDPRDQRLTRRVQRGIAFLAAGLRIAQVVGMFALHFSLTL